jgi:hypothetical protein
VSVRMTGCRVGVLALAFALRGAGAFAANRFPWAASASRWAAR